MAKHVWQCETCNECHTFYDNIWECPGCRKEICESCFDKFAHCKECAKDKTDKELIAASAIFGWEFDE